MLMVLHARTQCWSFGVTLVYKDVRWGFCRRALTCECPPASALSDFLFPFQEVDLLKCCQDQMRKLAKRIDFQIR